MKNDYVMTKAVRFHPKQGLRIPASFLRGAGFKEQEEYVIRVSTPIINIIPIKYDAGQEAEEKDWFDEAIETPKGKAYFKKVIDKAERDIKAGRLYSADAVFSEIKQERKK
ncbi:MAG: hypothetical protein AAB525_00390 [Patescibacteria group bacterium]